MNTWFTDFWQEQRARLAASPMLANLGWLTLDKLFRLSLSLVVGTWVARYLGPAGYGVMNYGLAIVALVSLLPGLGLDNLLRRELVRRPAEAGRLLGTAFTLRLATGAVSYAGLVGAMHWLEPNSAVRLAVATAGVSLVLQSVLTIDIWFQAQLLSKHTVIAQNAAFTVTSLARVGGILAGARLEYFLVLLALDAPICAALLVAAYRRGRHRLAGWSWDGPLARAMLAESWLLAVSGLVTLVYMKADQVLLRNLAGEAETGLYAGAVRLMEILHLLPMMLAQTFAPALALARAAGPREFENLMRRVLRLLSGTAWLAALAMAALAPWAVALLYGPAYARSATMLSVLALGLPFIAAGVARQEYLVNQGQVRFQLLGTVVGAALSLALNLWWIPRWGGLGAAAAATITYVVAGVLVSFLWTPTREIGRWQLRALLTPWRVVTRSKAGQSLLAALRRGLHEAAGSARHSRPALNAIDVQLERHLGFDGGFFVEAGAHDGFTQSNTYYFERFRKWRGLLIEPVPALYARCRRRRPKSRVVQAALVGPDYGAPEIELEYGDLMTAVPAAQSDSGAAERFAAMRAHYLPDCRPYRFKAPARTLSSLLDEHAPGRQADLLSLDVEGHEVEALRGLDLRRHRPRFICVETWDKPAVDALLAPYYDEVAILHANAQHCDVLYRLRAEPAAT